jgi:ankyrin repeat protein
MRKVSECVPVEHVEILLDLGVDPSVRNSEGETAIEIADSLGLIPVRDRLLAATRPN